MFEKLAYRSGKFTEQWAHERCLVPVELWPLLRHRRETHRPRPYNFSDYMRANPEYVAWALTQVRERGPITGADLVRGKAISLETDWFTTVERAVLEAHFGFGRLAIHSRSERFIRSYELAERIIPQELLDRNVSREDAEREFIRIAARAYGIATASDLADYFRMSPTDAKPRIAELVESGDLVSCDVERWGVPGYLHKSASLPRKVNAAALLSPFDPLIWYRRRVERLFEFDYRIEIFVPAAQHKWGYYVLPFLVGDRLVGRVDLRADRANSVLEVLGSWKETEDVADELAPELAALAAWLGLSRIQVAANGNLARALKRATSLAGLP